MLPGELHWQLYLWRWDSSPEKWTFHTFKNPEPTTSSEASWPQGNVPLLPNKQQDFTAGGGETTADQNLHWWRKLGRAKDTGCHEEPVQPGDTTLEGSGQRKSETHTLRKLQGQILRSHRDHSYYPLCSIPLHFCLYNCSHTNRPKKLILTFLNRVELNHEQMFM